MVESRVPQGTALYQLPAQEEASRLFIAVVRPGSTLVDVLAMHTLEMIPKSMILICTTPNQNTPLSQPQLPAHISFA